MISTTCNLSEYDGRHALVHRLNLPELESVRLKSLGIFEGQEITIQRTGSAVIILAAGGRIAVSDEIAKKIIVQKTIAQKTIAQHIIKQVL